ncbi:MFS transporter [Clavibacter sepedonicus]|uniref:MFS transporter n=1 Tax=Clavibacter TaxID=1573 RepID=UPI00059BD768|nr:MULTISPECIES: MFS transporter [Clavibacter]MBD5383321.1 MFS transporter [Clavibacter sp.]UUK66378.1 MFS transporter [Clavibacter sepedonicus]
MCAIQFLVAVEFSIVNVAVPDLQDDFGTAAPVTQWVLSAYAIGFASLLFLGGCAAERLGARSVVIGGLLCFSVTSGVAAMTPDIWSLIAIRVLQGASAAFLTPAALTLLTSLGDGPARDRWLALWGAAASVGFAGGVISGGVFTQLFGWRSVFVSCAVTACILLASSLFALPQVTSGARQVDVLGASLFALTGVSIASAFGMTADALGDARVAIWAAVLAAASGVLLIFQQQRSRNPLAPRGLLRRRDVKIGMLLSFVAPAAGGSMVYFSSLYMQNVLGWSELGTGVALLPDALAAAAGAYAAPALVRRVGVKFTVCVGFSAMLFGLLILCMRPSASTATVIQVLVGTSLTGFGLVLCGVVATVAGSRNLSKGEHGASAGILTASQQWGVAAGLALGANAVALSGNPAAGTLVGALVASMALLAILIAALSSFRRAPTRIS